jgi:hypothetical protein
VEEKLIEAVDELKVGESTTTTAEAAEESLSVTLTKTTTTKTEKITVETVKEAGVVLTTEISSVSTLLGDDTEPAKKTPGKRGRPKSSAAPAAVLAATKLAVGGKKKKGRSASALDEDDDASETPAPTAPRAKKVRE